MTGFIGYSPEQSERDAARIDGIMNKMEKHMEVFDRPKTTPEDYKKAEGYKNGAGVIVRAVNCKRDCLVAGGRTAALRKLHETKRRRHTTA